MLEFIVSISLLAELKPFVPLQEPFPSADQIWAFGAALCALWLFAMGASVGSFINVVVYRLPAGLNLSSPGSRCPRCLHPIRLRHNLPILGWLMLRGRCADCQLPISSRYPLVELLLGSLFLLVGGIELIGNGVNLPQPSVESGRPALNLQEARALGAATTIHLVLIATLVCAAIIENDGQRIPRRVALPAIAFAIAAAFAWPAVHPVAGCDDLLSATQLAELTPAVRRLWQSPGLDILLGGLAGVVVVALTKLACNSRRWLIARYGGVLTLLWIAMGVVFGWQLLPLLFLYWAVLQFIAPRQDLSKQLRPIFELTAVVILCVLIWRIIARYPRLLEPLPYAQPIAYAAVTFVATLLLFIAAARLPREFEFPQPVVDEAFLPTPAEPVSSSATDPPASEGEAATTMNDGELLSPQTDSEEPQQS